MPDEAGLFGEITEQPKVHIAYAAAKSGSVTAEPTSSFHSTRLVSTDQFFSWQGSDYQITYMEELTSDNHNPVKLVFVAAYKHTTLPSGCYVWSPVALSPSDHKELRDTWLAKYRKGGRHPKEIVW